MERFIPSLPPNVRRWTARDLRDVTAEDVALHAHGAELLPGCPEGVLTGTPAAVDPPCRAAIVSWEGRAPDGSTLEFTLRAELSDTAGPYWTRWWTLGLWSEDQDLRHSVAGQADETGHVDTDTLVLTKSAARLQWRVTLRRGSNAGPSLRAFTLATRPVPAPETFVPSPPIVLAVPELSQMAYRGGGPVWCSPTSLTMILHYWADRTSLPDLTPFRDPAAVPERTAPSVYDRVYDGTGNWPFNTAFAATLGLEAYVAWLGSLPALANWIAAGIPVIASIRWQPGELDHAPLNHSAGHLVVVTGFTPDGDVVVNDPRAAGGIDPIHRVYRRDQFERAWLGGSSGAVLLIYPPSQAPTSHRHR